MLRKQETRVGASVYRYTAQCQRRERLRVEKATVAMKYKNMSNMKEMSGGERKQKTEKRDKSTCAERKTEREQHSGILKE